MIDEKSAQQREAERQKEAGPQRAKGTFIVVGAGFVGHIFGDGSLYAGCREGEREGQHGSNQLVDTHSFCAKYIGQKDSVEEADQPAEKSGKLQDGSSGD